MNKIAASQSGRRSPQARSRVLIAVDQPVTRFGIAALINRERDLAICGEAGSGPEAVGLVSRLAPDLALVDLAHGTIGGIELIRDLKMARTNLRVLVMSMQDENIFAERALRAGAAGYFMKDRPVGDFLRAVRAVLGGELYLSEPMREKILKRLVRSPKDGADLATDALSDREMEVFRLIGSGYRTRQIAERLHLSGKTIDTHREHLKRKLAIGNADDLTRHAIQWAKSEDLG